MPGLATGDIVVKRALELLDGECTSKHAVIDVAWPLGIVSGHRSTIVQVVFTSDGHQSGLAHNSAVKSENIHTLPVSSVVQTIGFLPSLLMSHVDRCLKVSLELRESTV